MVLCSMEYLLMDCYSTILSYHKLDAPNITTFKIPCQRTKRAIGVIVVYVHDINQ